MFFVRSFLGFTVFQIVFYLCLQIAHNDLLIYAFSYLVHRFWEEDNWENSMYGKKDNILYLGLNLRQLICGGL